jgi:hypothetical protein
VNENPAGVAVYDYSRQLLEGQRTKVREMLPQFQRAEVDELIKMVRADERQRVKDEQKQKRVG